MKTLVYLCALIFLTVPLHADERIRRVQEELRKRNVFFGDIDGRKTPELSAAIRRYQERKGFEATGDLSDETLRSLDFPVAGNPPPLIWPDVVVLKSDGASEEKKPASTPPPVSESPAPAAHFATDSVHEFLEAYLHDAATNNLAAEMGYYAEPLDYFDHGIVDLAFVERDVRRYYERWPTRKYELLSFDLASNENRPDEAFAKFRIKFSVKNSQHSVSGETDNVFGLKMEGANYKIISTREQRVRRE